MAESEVKLLGVAGGEKGFAGWLNVELCGVIGGDELLSGRVATGGTRRLISFCGSGMGGGGGALIIGRWNLLLSCRVFRISYKADIYTVRTTRTLLSQNRAKGGNLASCLLFGSLSV